MALQYKGMKLNPEDRRGKAGWQVLPQHTQKAQRFALHEVLIQLYLANNKFLSSARAPATVFGPCVTLNSAQGCCPLPGDGMSLPGPP